MDIDILVYEHQKDIKELTTDAGGDNLWPVNWDKTLKLRVILFGRIKNVSSHKSFYNCRS